MCPATTGIAVSTWVYGAIAVASAAASVYQIQQQDKQVKAQNAAAQQQYDIEAERAKRDAQNRQNNLTNQALEEGSDFAQRREKLKLDALRAQSAARAASAESGVGGVTSIRSFLSETISEDLARSDIQRSQDLTQFNLNQQARGITTAQHDRVVNAEFTRRSNTRRRPTGLDYGLAAVQGAASGYATASSFG